MFAVPLVSLPALAQDVRASDFPSLKMHDTDRDGAASRLLLQIQAGRPEARGELIALLYEDLRDRARRLMSAQRADHTLQATAVVNEACVRLLGNESSWNDRAHFLSAAASAMRSVLVDHARTRNRQKRTAAGERVPLDELLTAYETEGIDVDALDSALAKLSGFAPEMTRAVELRYFAGLGVDETAQVLGMSKRAFEREWTATRAWLRGELE